MGQMLAGLGQKPQMNTDDPGAPGQGPQQPVHPFIKALGNALGGFGQQLGAASMGVQPSAAQAQLMQMFHDILFKQKPQGTPPGGMGGQNSQSSGYSSQAPNTSTGLY